METDGGARHVVIVSARDTSLLRLDTHIGRIKISRWQGVLVEDFRSYGIGNNGSNLLGLAGVSFSPQACCRGRNVIMPALTTT